MSDDRVGTLVTELDAAHHEFLAAFADVDPDLRIVPGLLGAWSAQDLVAHVAFWSAHAADALALVAAERGAEFAYDKSQTDAMNDDVFVATRDLGVDDALARETQAFGRFRDALAGTADEALEQRLGNGDTLEEVVRYDGPDHYAEHTAHLRAWFNGEPEGDPDQDPEPEGEG